MAISGPIGTRIAMDISLIRKTNIPQASNTIAVAKLAMLKAAILGHTKKRSRISVYDIRYTFRCRQLTKDVFLPKLRLCNRQGSYLLHMGPVGSSQQLRSPRSVIGGLASRHDEVEFPRLGNSWRPYTREVYGGVL